MQNSRKAAFADSTNSERPSFLLHDVAVIVVILLIQLAAFFLVWPNQEFPVIDDWDYAATVNGLLESHKILLSDWPAMPLVTHVAWGAAFTKLIGFSYFHLRISTLVLAILTDIALYAWGRVVGLRRSTALFLTLCLALNPIWIFYISTFMTDVPGVAWMMFALLSLRLRFNFVQHRWRCFWTGVLIGIAFLVRQTSGIWIFTVVVGEAVWLFRKKQSRSSSIWIVLEDSFFLLLPFCAIVGSFYYWLYKAHPGVPYNFDRMILLDWRDPHAVLGRLAWIVLHCGFYLSPLSACIVYDHIRRRDWPTQRVTLAIAAILAGLFAIRIFVGSQVAAIDNFEFFDLGYGCDFWLNGRNQVLAGPAISVFGTKISLFTTAVNGLAYLGVLGILLQASLILPVLSEKRPPKDLSSTLGS